jgi:hypothetical protein
MEKYQIKGLEKLLNSDMIKKIYPMVDHIDIKDISYMTGEIFDKIMLTIYLNDPSINKDNMYSANFDPHYLADVHLEKLLPYLNINRPIVNFDVRGTRGELIDTWKG